MTILSKDIFSKYSFYILLSILIIPNLIISGNTELAHDETYYWIYSQFLDFGFFDHPPMVGLSIFLGTFIFGDNEFGVRFFSSLYLLGTAVLMWDMVKAYQERLIFWALLFSMPLINFSGIVALPDTPLMFFTAMFFWSLKKYIYDDNLKSSLLLAISIALMFYSKYHGLLIILLTVCGHPAFLKKKSFWGVAAIVAVLFIPHMYWQYQHDFVSFKFHLFQRTEKHFSLHNIFDYIGGQIFLMGFLNFFVFCFVFYKNQFKDKFERILVFNTFGFLAFLLIMSLRNQIEANWTISVSIAFIILMVKYLAPYRRWVVGFASINIVIILIVKIGFLNADILVDEESGENRLNEVVHWKNKRIPKILDVCDGTKIVGDNYQITSKLAFYTNNARIPALHLGSRESQYSILKLQNSIGADEEICYLTSKNLENSVRIETNYKDPVYILKSTTLNKLGQRYGLSYEEIIRN